MDDFSMDWDQEIQDMVDDLLLDALVLELCRLAAAQAPSSLARFPSECLPGLVDRCGGLWITDVEPGAGRPRQGQLSHISRVRT